MAFHFTTNAAFRVRGRIKLARILEIPERDFEREVRELESDALYGRLVELGVLRLKSYPQARFVPRRFDGRELRAGNDGFPELLDGQGDLARLISRVGREDFTDCFLKDEALSDGARAARCGIDIQDAERLRAFVDRLYVRSEFENPEGQAAPPTVFSAVAGISAENGRPVIGFFNREIWKCRYEIDETRCVALKSSLTPEELRRIDKFLQKAALIDRWKTTLYRLLEILIEEQAEYLISGEPERRRALTQRAAAERLGADPSVVNRIIANKSVETPWGLEIPIKSLLPSRKTILRDQLYDIAIEQPEYSASALADELLRRCGARISPRSVGQYRAELGLMRGRGERRCRLPANFTQSDKTNCMEAA